MNGTLKCLVTVAIMFVAFAVLGALGSELRLWPFVPDLALPIILFMAMTEEVDMTRGAVTSFCVGYLQDLFAGTPMSLHTFLAVAVFFVARGSRFQFSVRGLMFQFGLVAAVSLLQGSAALALRSIFGPAAAQMGRIDLAFAWQLLGQATATAAVAPALLFWVRRVEVGIGLGQVARKADA